jgi:zinc transporter, ZIP family
VTARPWWYALAPLVVLAAFVLAIFRLDALHWMGLDAPALERLGVEQIKISKSGFEVLVRNNGAEPLQLAQVMVDGAYWVFSSDHSGPIARLDTTRLSIDFPWGSGETHHLRFITSIGSTFDHTIETALETPQPSTSVLARLAVLGILVGLLPIIVGMLFYPALQRLDQGLEFVLALTQGLLGYLFIDMGLEGLELAAAASPLLGGPVLVLIPLLVTIALLLLFNRRQNARTDGLRLAVLVALGVGAHNFGEGLAIGASFAANELAVGSVLVLGFALHNTTEGIALVAPIAKQRTRLLTLLALALLAGVPLVPGLWLGTFSSAPHWAAVFFGIGAGAVAEVIIELDRYIARQQFAGALSSRFSATSVAGYCTGAALIYGSSLAIPI